MSRKICCVLLALSLLMSFAMAESTSEAVSYDAIYSADNPIPEIAERVRPSVVRVVASLENWDATSRISSVDDASSGSASYILADVENGGGYVLTNYHVVKDCDVYRIEWLSGERMDAELVGYDDGTDIAVLHFSEAAPEGAEPIPMGDSDALRIGELAICVSNPGTADGNVLLGTVNAGIISGLQRQDVNAGNFSRSLSVIQIDAAINSGSSGGALLNAAGELVGIPTLKYMVSNTSIYEGLGFCIPINAVRDFIDQIITTGGVVRPRLGVTVAAVDGPDEPMRRYPPIGLQIYTIDENGPSAAAGLQEGDIITEINGTRVTTVRELLSEIDKCAAGDKVELKAYRYYDEQGNLTGSYEELNVSVALELLD